MALTQNASVEYEANQQAFPFEAMSQDTVDPKTYNASVSPFSRVSGAAVVVVPYGLDTGGAVSPESGGTDDQVDVAAAVVRMAAVPSADDNGKVSVSGTTLTATRGSTQDFLITAITVDNTGAYVAIAGTEGTSFSDTRGGPGGPPFIPVDSIEIAHIRLSSQVAGPVSPQEISQVDGISTERYTFPIWSTNYLNGSITFSSELPQIHTGSVEKLVYVRGATPIFVEKSRSRNWTPAEQTNSVSSEEYYDGPVVSVSSSVGQASFETVLENGHTDPILQLVGEAIWCRFKQDKFQSASQYVNGLLAIDRDFTHGADPTATCTISASAKSTDLA